MAYSHIPLARQSIDPKSGHRWIDLAQKWTAVLVSCGMCVLVSQAPAKAQVASSDTKILFCVATKFVDSINNNVAGVYYSPYFEELEGTSSNELFYLERSWKVYASEKYGLSISSGRCKSVQKNILGSEAHKAQTNCTKNKSATCTADNWDPQRREYAAIGHPLSWKAEMPSEEVRPNGPGPTSQKPTSQKPIGPIISSSPTPPSLQPKYQPRPAPRAAPRSAPVRSMPEPGRQSTCKKYCGRPI